MEKSLLLETTGSRPVIAGFDGFIDSIIHVVHKRRSGGDVDLFSTISQFGEAIQSVGGKSTNYELLVRQRLMGGNGPLMANALARFGHQIHYVGALGYPRINEVFKDFATSCSSVTSLAEPAYTDALEFDDGKLMLGKMSSLEQINRDVLDNALPRDAREQLVKDVSLVVFNNWTMIPGMNGIIELFMEDFQRWSVRPVAFFDLADPGKRDDEDVHQLLYMLKDMGRVVPVVLSLNQRESQIIAALLGKNHSREEDRARALCDALELACCVIHPLKGAAAADNQGNSLWVDGPYTSRPERTTGAGDHFNAGFMAGWLAQSDLKKCLKTGVYTSGYYVRNAKPPHRKQLNNFYQEYTKSL